MLCPDAPIDLDRDIDIDIDLPDDWICSPQPAFLAIEASDIPLWKPHKRHRCCHRAFTLETGTVTLVEHTLRASPRSSPPKRQTQPMLKPAALLL